MIIIIIIIIIILFSIVLFLFCFAPASTKPAGLKTVKLDICYRTRLATVVKTITSLGKCCWMLLHCLVGVTRKASGKDAVSRGSLVTAVILLSSFSTNWADWEHHAPLVSIAMDTNIWVAARSFYLTLLLSEAFSAAAPVEFAVAWM